MKNQRHYLEQQVKMTAAIGRLKRHNRYFIMGEIALFMLIIASIGVFAMTAWSKSGLLMAVVCLSAYLFTRFFDNKNASNIKQTEQLLAVYTHELEAIEGNYSAFDSGQEFVDYRHPFTFDLDIFGQNSLFARLNRTQSFIRRDTVSARGNPLHEQQSRLHG